MVRIPEHLPQFPDGAVIAAVGVVHGRLWLARNGEVVEVEDLTPEFTHRTGEGFFWQAGRGVVAKTGTPEAYDQESDVHRFAHLFLEAVRKLMVRERISRLYLFVAPEAAGRLLEHLAPAEREQVVVVERKNYAKYHDPLFLISRIAEHVASPSRE